MKKKLDDQSTAFLNNRIELSREMRVFKLVELAKNWQIGWVSLYRYSSEQYRKNSQKDAKRALRNAPKIDKTLCQICFEPLKGHKRCQDCTMLQHGKPECSCDMIREFLQEIGDPIVLE